LRADLLDQLLQSRVATKEAWFQKISVEARSSTDNRQIARFLDSVLAIIAEYV
jgi:hypothetical protein